MKIKTSNLTGLALDWAVAKAEGTGKKSLADFARLRGYYAYTTDWAQGGPIIEHERIQTQWETDDSGDTRIGCWVATHCLTQGQRFQATGETPLIAAMRAYVALKLGVEVEIPEELK